MALKSSLTPEQEEKLSLTLFIDISSSQCGNCRMGTLPEAKKHTKVSGYGPPRDGCGVEWKYVSSNYSGLANQEELIRGIRPDLEYYELRTLYES